MDFLKKIFAAEYDFDAMGQFFKNLYNGGFAGFLKDTLDSIFGATSAIQPILGYLLLVLALIQLFLGKRLLGAQKLIGCIVVGYAASVAYLVPVLANWAAFFGDQPWIVGIVFAVIGGLFYKFFYMVAYVFAFAYIPYFLLYSGTLTAALAGKAVIAGAAAAVIVVFAIVFRKWFEMLGLSALGAYCVIKVLDVKFGVIELLQMDAKTISLILIGVLTLIGFIIQVKTRKRY